ncbi:MAG: hypothetical protein AVDCRST_MAG89-4709, partial [uncultured Gemmatimonadetes bacterium]
GGDEHGRARRVRPVLGRGTIQALADENNPGGQRDARGIWSWGAAVL